MPDENKEKRPKIYIGIAIIIFIIIVIVIFVLGVTGIFKIISTIAVITLFIALLFGLAWLFWFIFLKKQRYDVTYVNKQRLIQAGKINNQKGLLGDLYLSGDAGHKRVRIGKIIGYCRIQILARNTKLDEEGEIKTRLNEEGQRVPDYKIGKEEQDVFILKKGLGIFSDGMVIRVEPTDHDSLIGDVTLNGFSITPHSEYWYLNKDFLDVRKIDFAILKEAERGIMFESLRDMKAIVDKSVGLDSSHKKEIEKKNLMELPENIGIR